MIFRRTTGLRDLVASHCDGETLVHLPSFGIGGDYATLCGMDLDHSDTEAHRTKLNPGARVDCPQCVALWYGAKSIPASFISPDAIKAEERTRP